MGGVDANDQLCGYYKVVVGVYYYLHNEGNDADQGSDRGRSSLPKPSKCKKHYNYIFCFLFDLAITDAYILWKSNPASQ